MATDDAIDRIWEQYWLGRQAGTHYSESTASVLLFDDGTNGLQTHAMRGPRIEEGSPDLVKSALLVGAGVLLASGAMKAAPKVKVWWNGLRLTPSRSVATRDVEGEGEAQAAALSAISIEDFSHAVDVALEEHRMMSSAEAERRMLEILLAAAIIAKNMRDLSGAHIEDDASLELEAAMKKLTVPQLTDSLNQMLEMDSSVLDDETSAVFMQIFEGGRSADNQYVPLQHKKVDEALRLSRNGA